jgi:hypothetical protein
LSEFGPNRGRALLAALVRALQPGTSTIVMSALPDARAVSISSAGYEDGLGRRSVRFDREVGGMLECLRLRPELRAFEASLRRCAEAIARLEDERFVPVRAIERDAHGLTVVSELVPGERLIDVIEARQRDGAPVFGIDAAIGFLLQALPALSVLHSASMAHGLVSPGRVLVTPAAQIVLLDAIYAASIERLNMNRTVLWSTLGVLASPAAGATRLDRQTDVVQAALCALMLATGKSVDVGEPAALAPLVQEAAEVAEIRGTAEFAIRVRQFFTATLPLAGRRPVITTDDATFEARALAELVGEESCHAALAELARAEGPVRPAPTAAPEPRLVIVPPPKAVEDEAFTDIVEEAVAEPEPVRHHVPETVAAVEEPAVVAPPPVVVPPPAFVQAPIAPRVEVQEPAVTSVAPPIAVAPIPMPVPLIPAPPVPAPFVPVTPAIGITVPPAPIPIAVAPPAPLRVKQEPPPGFVPARADADTSMRALPFVDRAREDTPARFPWKLAAAALVVLGIAIVAGRAYLPGDDPVRLDASAEGGAPVTVDAAPPPAAPRVTSTSTGSLTVESQPAGARVSLDGREIGSTPVSLDGIEPGRYTVSISTPTATVRRAVRIEAGRVATVDVPVFSGWLAVFSPVSLDVAIAGRTVGSTETGKIMLPPGRHVLTLSNRELGYSETRSVEIHPGEERPLNVEPKSTVNVNAHPWAEVWVDGRKAGDTPIANLSVLLGTRIFVFKHPQFGERRVTMTITATPGAVTVDLTRPE